MWISVDDALPEDHDFVLIAHKDYGTPMKAIFHDDLGGYFEFVTMQGKKNSVYLFEAKFHEKTITHWMELPALPENTEV